MKIEHISKSLNPFQNPIVHFQCDVFCFFFVFHALMFGCLYLITYLLYISVQGVFRVVELCGGV